MLYDFVVSGISVDPDFGAVSRFCNTAVFQVFTQALTAPSLWRLVIGF